MATEKGFTRITELVTALNAALRDMEHGRLGAQGLERATEESRELFERLVVLRHKVREARAVMATKAAEGTPAEARALEPPKSEAPVQQSMRLDTRPPEPPRQTSLIDAIAEHEEVPVEELKGQEQVQAQEVPKVQLKPNDAPKVQAQQEPGKAPAPAKAASLAERLENAPIADLGKAISLSQKFLFMAELFEGQHDAYEQAIEVINGHRAYPEARRFVDDTVLAKLKKTPDPETVSSFMDLVERRFK